MTKVLSLLGGLALLAGCSTVQVAQFDKTRPPTQKVDFYHSTDEVKRKYRELGYLAYGGKISDGNSTGALGKLLDRARKLGADGVILQSGRLEQPTNLVMRATAIIYE